MLYIIIDIVILLILALFAWRGAKKGLILTLFGLLGLVVAFFGARFISGAFYEPVADIIEPGIYQNVKKLEDSALDRTGLDFNEDFDLGGLTELLRGSEQFSGVADLLDEITADDTSVENLGYSAVERLSEYLAHLLAKLALFIVSFLAILLLWFLISHLLDLAFKLPILSAVNLAGGLILGLVKAAFIVVVLVWMGQLMGWLPAEPTTPVLSVFTLDNLAGWLNKIIT